MHDRRAAYGGGYNVSLEPIPSGLWMLAWEPFLRVSDSHPRYSELVPTVMTGRMNVDISSATRSCCIGPCSADDCA